MMSRIEFLLQILSLNDVTRTGWERRGISDPQMVAGHVWGVAILTMFFAPEADVDRDRAIRMALVHDIAEAKVGDIPMGEVYQEMDVAEKVARERAAINELVNLADGTVPNIEELQDLWSEFEDGSSAEAQFVRDMDLLDMCLLALHYERQNRYKSDEKSHNHLDGFFETATRNIKTNTGVELLAEVEQAYRRAKQT